MPPHSPLDPQALFEKHGAFVQRLAGAMVADEHMAEDLAHETWAAVVSRPPVGVRDVRAWLSTILQRRVASYRRRMGKGDRVEAVEPETAQVASDGAAQQLEHQHVLHAAVRALDEPYRSTVYLRFHEGLPPRVIAAQAGVPVKTVKTRLSRALAKLRAALEGEFKEDLKDHAGARLDWRLALAPIGAPRLAATKLASSVSPVHLASSTTPLLFGMKKLIAVAVLLLASAAWFLQRAAPIDRGLTAGAEAPRAVPEADGQPVSPVEELDAPAVREEVTQGGRSPGQSSKTTAKAAKLAAVVVHVRNAAGEPIPGRPVVLKAWAWASAGEPAIVHRTDGAGRASFPGLRPSHYVLSDGRGGTEEDFEMDQGETKTLRWTVEGEVLVRGQVLDSSPGSGDRALAGADIWCTAGGGRSDPIWRAGRTNSQGHFEVRCSRGAVLQATATGLSPSRLRTVGELPETEPGVREVTFQLAYPGSPFAGRVVDENGDPVEGATVVVLPKEWPHGADERGSAPRPTPAYSDGAGWFTFPGGLPDGEHPAIARASGFAAAMTTVRVGRPMVAARFVLYRGVEVLGAVTHPDGRPAPKANVWIADPKSKWQVYGSGSGPSVQADQEGRFTLRGVPPGELSVRAQSGWTEALARAVQTVEVTGQSLGGLQLVLDAGRTISGRILDPDGLPVSGMVVTARCRWETSNDVVTDSDGTYRISALPAPGGGKDEWDVIVRAWTGGSVRHIASKSGVGPNSQDVDFVVERIEEASGRISGRIAAVTRRIPGDVQAFLAEHGSGDMFPLPFDAATGAFSKGPLRPGTYRIQLLRAGVPVVGKSNLVVGSGETIDAGVIRLDDGASIEVRPAPQAGLGTQSGQLDAMFKDAAASIIGPAGNQVWLEWSDGAWRHQGTVEPGVWRLMIFAEQLIFPGRDVTLEPGTRGHFDIAVEPGRRVDVRVQLPAGPDEWSEVKIAIRGADGTMLYEGPSIPRAALESPTATSVVWTVPLGTTRISATTDTRVGVERTLDIAPGDEPLLTLPLMATGGH